MMINHCIDTAEKKLRLIHDATCLSRILPFFSTFYLSSGSEITRGVSKSIFTSNIEVDPFWLLDYARRPV
jgi:hypothetical protein